MADLAVDVQDDQSAKSFGAPCSCAGRFCHYGGACMEYMAIAEAAAKWKLSNRRIQVLCAQERIPGVCRIGNILAIPKDAEKPVDARVKSGMYKKNTQVCEK